MSGTIIVSDAGPLTLVEDLGRPGHAAIGVTGSGALDRGALRLGNRLLGNDEGAAGLEIVFGPFAARFSEPAWFVVTGAWGPMAIDGVEIDSNVVTRASAGAELRLGRAERGIRFYLSVRGGIDAPVTLGSRSSDLLSALGPAPIATGDTMSIGPEPAREAPLLDFVPFQTPDAEVVIVRAHPGPRADWFTPAAVDAFFEGEWTVSAASNRVGTRLDAFVPPTHVAGLDPKPVVLERAVSAELPSEPMFAGAVQVSPDGTPTVLLADHPVTGGYPVIAVVADASLDLFAQLRPGQLVQFRHA